MKIVCSLSEVHGKLRQIQEENLPLKEYMVLEQMDREECIVCVMGIRIMIPKYEVYLRLGSCQEFETPGENSATHPQMVYVYDMAENALDCYKHKQQGKLIKVLSDYVKGEALATDDISHAGCILDLETY